MCLAMGSTLPPGCRALAEPDTICISDMVYRDVVQEAGLGDGRLAGQAQAQEHCRALPGLCAAAGITARAYGRPCKSSA